MSRATFALENPDAHEATLTFTMDIAAWKKLRDQMQRDRWPSCDLTSAITSMIFEFEKREFWRKKENDDG